MQKIMIAYTYHRLVTVGGNAVVVHAECIKNMNLFILKGSVHIDSDFYIGENPFDYGEWHKYYGTTCIMQYHFSLSNAERAARLCILDRDAITISSISETPFLDFVFNTPDSDSRHKQNISMFRRYRCKKRRQSVRMEIGKP